MPDQSQLIERLSQLRRIVRRRMVLFGICAVASGGIFAFVAMTFLDWFLSLPPAPRLILSLIYVLGGLLATRRWVVVPLQRPVTLGQLAEKIEQYEWDLPDGESRLHDRLTSTVDFLLGNQAGSEQMRQQVIANTDRLVESIRFGDVLSHRKLATHLASLGAALIVMFSLLWAAPQFAGIGLQRFVAPFGAVDWPRKVQLISLSRDTRVAVGESAVLRMKVVQGLSPTLRGVVHLRSSGGQTAHLAMRPDDGGVFTCTVPAITEDLTCWFEAGDNNTADRPIVIRAVQRPVVTESLVTIHPPAYVVEQGTAAQPADSENQTQVAARQPVVLDLHVEQIEAVRDSRLTITVRSSKPFLAAPASPTGNSTAPSHPGFIEFADGARLPLEWDSTVSRPQEQSTAMQGALTASFDLDADKEFQIRIYDADGLENRMAPTHRIVAVDDQTPNVVVLKPQALTEVTPTGSVNVVIRADDDFGISGMTIEVRDLDTQHLYTIELKDHTLVTPAGDRVIGLADYEWSMAEFQKALTGSEGFKPLEPGVVLTYYAEARDNFAGPDSQPHVGQSSTLRLKIISQAEFEQSVRENLALLQERIRRAMMDQAALKDRTDSLGQELPAGDDPLRPQLEMAHELGVSQARLAERVLGLARQFQQLHTRIERNQAADAELMKQVADLVDALSGVANSEMTSASRSLGEAADASAANHADLVAQSAGAQQKALAILRQTLRTLDRWGDFQGVVSKTRNLLDRQQALREQTARLGKQAIGKALDQLTQEEQTELRQLQRRQEEVAEEAQRLIEQLEKLIDQLRESDPAGAEALAQALRAARSAEVVLRTRQAADAVASNRTAAALIEQRSAESGMSKMLSGLQERQQRELAELQKRIEDFRVAIADLLIRQKDLLAANEEAGKLNAKPDVFTALSGEQHALARNTSGVAADMDARQDVPGPARLVGESVEPMNDAKAALGDASWQLAHDRQRLAADKLTAALAELEELARKADEEAFQRTVTALLIELHEIRQKQGGINSESAELIGRVDQGEQLGRMDFRRIVRLSRDQDAVRTGVGGIREGLGDAQVYRWVLDQIDQQIGISMDKLDRREISAALAAAQTGIVHELDVLIEALQAASALPPADDYEEQASQGSGGGGQDSQTTRVPGVAELLVLKSMQADLNKRIKQFPADFNPDNASEQQLKELRDLAARQDEIRRLTETVTERANHAP